MTFVTANLPCKDSSEAQKIADALVNAHLVACAKILPGVSSTYFWNDVLEHSNEVLLILDTHESRLVGVEEAIAPLHSHKTFVLTATPMVFVSKDAGRWFQESIKLLG